MHWYTLPLVWIGYYVLCMGVVLVLWLTRQISHAGSLDLSDWFPLWRMREGSLLLKLSERVLGGRVMGQAIGLNVLVRKSSLDLMREVVRHEECHCWQQLILGPLFPVLYALSSLYLKLFTDKDPYFCNPFEVQARRYTSRA